MATDKRLEYLNYLIDFIKAENKHQLNKWGVQSKSYFRWMCYLTKEVGELAEAISEFEENGALKFNIFDEAIQVATLALKIAEMTAYDC